MDLVHAYKVNVRFLITLIATESSFFVKFLSDFRPVIV